MVKVEVEKVKEPREPITGLKLKTSFYVAFFKSAEVEKTKKAMEKLRDNRGDWQKPMYEAILKKVKYDLRTAFDINKILKEFEETVIGMCQRFKESIKFDETPKQKALDEFDAKKAMDEDLKKRQKKG